MRGDNHLFFGSVFRVSSERVQDVEEFRILFIKNLELRE